MTYNVPSLKYYRLENRLTQEELSKISKVSRSTIARIENGYKSNHYQISLLAKALSVPIENLINKDNKGQTREDLTIYDVNAPLVNVKNIKATNKRRSMLTRRQKERIEFLYETFKNVFENTKEEWIYQFEQDKHPENELNIWEEMAGVYNIINRKASFNNNQKKEIFKYLLSRSQNSRKQMKKIIPKYIKQKTIKQIEKLCKFRALPMRAENIDGNIVNIRTM